MTDMVNHPEHYTRGPEIVIPHYPDCIHNTSIVVECIQVIRHIRDMRLANAMKYIWRVGFGGKANNIEDIKKAIFYLNDWLEHPLG